MKQGLRTLFSKLSLFWRYFFLLVAVVLVFLVSHLVSTHQFSSALRQSYMEQAQSAFEQRSEGFSSQLFLTYSLPSSSENDGNYAVVAGTQQTADTS